MKLHGSLNFPDTRSVEPDSHGYSLAKPEPEPVLLPPIFNKLSNEMPTGIWKSALETLRAAKNVAVVGYSLPRTDIYMQYFLKAALGPNVNLNRIIVFDPVLFGSHSGAQEMRERYETCFSPQLRSRICFEPVRDEDSSDEFDNGTADHFVDTLLHCPDELIF